MSEEGNLFANVLTKKRNKAEPKAPASATKEEPEPQNLFAGVLKKSNPIGHGRKLSSTFSEPAPTGKRHLFSKKREATVSVNKDINKGNDSASKEESKNESQSPNRFQKASASKSPVVTKETKNANLDNLFAPAANKERKTAMNQKQRDLSEGFLMKANTGQSGGKLAKQVNNLTKEPKGRGSVSSAIAMFQGNINDKNSGRDSTKPQVIQKKINMDVTSDVNSGRGSVKDMILQFNSNIAQAAIPDKDKLLPRRPSMNDNQSQGRASLGEAFLTQVNRKNNHKEERGEGGATRNQSQGFRLRRQESDGRLSMGDQFMVAVNKKHDDEDQKSNQSGPRKTNIFNKVRAMQASQKFSVLSEGGAKFNQKNDSSNNIFAKKEIDSGIVERNDGGNLVSMNQMMSNLIDNDSPTKEGKSALKKDKKMRMSKDKSLVKSDPATPMKVVGGKQEAENQDANETGILQDLDDIEAPHSPDPIKEGERSQFIIFADNVEKNNQTDRIESNTNPFTLQGSLKELKADAQEHRRYSAYQKSQQSQPVSRDGSENNRRRVLKVKKLGKVASRETSDENRQATDKSKPSADIIIYQDLDKQPYKDEVKKSRDNSQEVQMAKAAEKRNNQPKTKEHELHDFIGHKIANQERQHSINERAFKLEHEKPGARKMSHKFPKSSSEIKMQAEPDIIMRKTVVPSGFVKKEKDTTQVIEKEMFAAAKENNKTTRRPSKKLNKSGFETTTAREDDFVDAQTNIVSHNRSDLFAESPSKIKVTKRDSTKRSELRNNSQSFTKSQGRKDRSNSNMQHQPPISGSAKRNESFLEYVIGADSLMPKRVRSRMSGSNSRQGGANISQDAADILKLQNEISAVNKEGKDSDQLDKFSADLASKSKGSQSRSKILNQIDGLEEPEYNSDDQADLVYVEEDDHDMRATAQEQEPFPNTEGNEEQDDQQDMDEVERRVAEQQQMLAQLVDNNAQNEDFNNSPESPDVEGPYYSNNDNNVNKIRGSNIDNAEAIAAEIARKEDAAMYKQSQKALARYLDTSKEESFTQYQSAKIAVKQKKHQDLNSGQKRYKNNDVVDNQHDQLTNLHHELELEELEKSEQRKLEQAIQQACGNEMDDQTFPSMDEGKKGNNISGQEQEAMAVNASQPDFNDVSNIQGQPVPDTTVDISAMQQNIDHIDAATSGQKRRNMRPRPMTTNEKRQSGVSNLDGSRLPDISDVTDPHALQRNYLEKSANDVSNMSSSVVQEKNQREQQLKYELEILELELELQMNEAEISDDEQEAHEQSSQRVSQMEQKQFKPNQSNNSEIDGKDINDMSHQSYSGMDPRRHKSSRVDQTHVFQDGTGFDGNLRQQVNLRQHASQAMSTVSQQQNQRAKQEQPIKSINIDDQEVLCSNCYDTIPMASVDEHSTTCFKDEPSFRQTMNHDGRRLTTVTIDEENEFNSQREELNERIFKLIQTFLRKLDSQVFLDQIYTTQLNEGQDEQYSNNNMSAFSASGRDKFELEAGDDKNGLKKSAHNNSAHQQLESNQKYQKSATALAEERSLIHEVVQHAHLALQGELHDIQNAAEQLENLEEEHDLNSKFDFNNHMVFNRIVQVVNIKLEVVQEWEKKLNPDIVVPYTSKQLREMDQSGGQNYGFHELSLANVKKLPLNEPEVKESKTTTNKGNVKRMNHEEQQLHEFIQASKAQAMLQRKKKGNIFTQQKRAGGQDSSGVENWVLSDMGSDNQSMGGDSTSSFSNAHVPRFQAASALQRHKPQDSTS